jgi:hypothetical protein
MSHETAQAPSTEPSAIAACSVLVVSRDPQQRRAVLGELAAHEHIDVSCAPGFHVAVPMLWSGSPDVLVVGALSPEDVLRLPELLHHAGGASLVLIGSDEYDAPAGSVGTTTRVLDVIGSLHPAR